MITPWFFLGPATIPYGPSFDAGTGAEVFGSLLASSTTTDSGLGAEPGAFLALAVNTSDGGAGSEAWLSLSASTTTADNGVGDALALYAATLYGTDSGTGADASTLLATLAVQTDTGAGGAFAVQSDVTSVRAPATGILVVVQTESFAEEGAAPVIVPVYGGGFCEQGILGEPKS